jgi:hypothetical protein
MALGYPGATESSVSFQYCENLKMNVSPSFRETAASMEPSRHSGLSSSVDSVFWGQFYESLLVIIYG